MAKTIMISNEVYEELKEIKNDKSFSEVLKELIKENKAKKGSNLQTCFGLIKEGWEESKEDIDRGWKNWSKKYA